MASPPNLSCLKGVGSHLLPIATSSITTYLLDTNTFIALINSTEANLRRRFRRVVARESVVLLSSIVAFELWYGVAKSQRKDHNRRRLAAFLAGPFE
jgi:tRNA(fMet)-specific endonuclease VapC